VNPDPKQAVTVKPVSNVKEVEQREFWYRRVALFLENLFIRLVFYYVAVSTPKHEHVPTMRPLTMNGHPIP
jgi:hypothetical protein